MKPEQYRCRPHKFERVGRPKGKFGYDTTELGEFKCSKCAMKVRL